jgi:hypothetical protein
MLVTVLQKGAADAVVGSRIRKHQRPKLPGVGSRAYKRFIEF